ncbi:MAG: polyprenyl synthetase family protein [Lachnospiraceae bacterium]|nr:polyprenyl synthetase family protein [Lachnospiraceae bacterium]
MSDFKDILNNKVNEAYDLIKEFLPKEEGLQKRVAESMNYSFNSGGKRLRPMFMMESYRLFGGEDLSKIAPFMAAIEMIHTYSLIHDDLPAMDNDDYRRGRLTNHKMFDEATAILAGDGLLNYAFETLSLAMKKEEDPLILKRMVSAFEVLSRKAGINGMIGGQIVDLEMEHKKDVSLDTLLFIHKCKTAALIEASLMTGAIMAGADDENISKIEKAGYNTGLAFQIQDDILDVTGDFKTLGKSVGSDEKNEKITYVSLKGLKESEEEQKHLSEEAVEIVKEIGNGDTFLSDLIEYLITRNN